MAYALVTLHATEISKEEQGVYELNEDLSLGSKLMNATDIFGVDAKFYLRLKGITVNENLVMYYKSDPFSAFGSGVALVAPDGSLLSTVDAGNNNSILDKNAERLLDRKTSPDSVVFIYFDGNTEVVYEKGEENNASLEAIGLNQDTGEIAIGYRELSYLDDPDPSLTEIRFEDGTLKWSKETRTPDKFLFANGDVYVVNEAIKIVRLDGDTGDLKNEVVDYINNTYSEFNDAVLDNEDNILVGTTKYQPS